MDWEGWRLWRLGLGGRDPEPLPHFSAGLLATKSKSSCRDGGGCFQTAPALSTQGLGKNRVLPSSRRAGGVNHDSRVTPCPTWVCWVGELPLGL